MKAPEPADPWTGIYDATEFGPSCHQPDHFDIWIISEQPEDFPEEKEEERKNNSSGDSPSSSPVNESKGKDCRDGSASPRLTDDVRGSRGEEHECRYLVQDYMKDVSEDCLSLNVYTPLVSLYFIYLRVCCFFQFEITYNFMYHLFSLDPIIWKRVYSLFINFFPSLI